MTRGMCALDADLESVDSREYMREIMTPRRSCEGCRSALQYAVLNPRVTVARGALTLTFEG